MRRFHLTVAAALTTVFSNVVFAHLSFPVSNPSTTAISSEKLRELPKHPQTRYGIDSKIGFWAADGNLSLHTARKKAQQLANDLCLDESTMGVESFVIATTDRTFAVPDDREPTAFYKMRDENTGEIYTKEKVLPTRWVFYSKRKVMRARREGRTLHMWETHAVPAYEFVSIECIR